MASEAYASCTRRALTLSILMVLMTQVGYLDAINPWSEAWSGNEASLDDTAAVLETGGQG